MDDCTKHFSDFKQTKSGTLTKEIAKRIEVKSYNTIDWNIVDDLDWVHHLASKQAAYVPNLLCALMYPQH